MGRVFLAWRRRHPGHLDKARKALAMLDPPAGGELTGLAGLGCAGDPKTER